MVKIFKLKNFNYFVWTHLGSRVNIYVNFCLQVQFKMTAAWYCTHYLPPVSLTRVANLPPASLIPVAICHWRCCHRWQICHRYRWLWWQICHRNQQPRWCTLTCEYLREFTKKFETVLMQYFVVGGKLIHQKNQKQKISWHCPFKQKNESQLQQFFLPMATICQYTMN